MVNKFLRGMFSKLHPWHTTHEQSHVEQKLQQLRNFERSGRCHSVRDVLF